MSDILFVVAGISCGLDRTAVIRSARPTGILIMSGLAGRTATPDIPRFLTARAGVSRNGYQVPAQARETIMSHSTVTEAASVEIIGVLEKALRQ